MKPVAYILVGLPGAGKSTWAEPYLAREQYELVSSDFYIDTIAKQMGKTYGDVFKDTIDAATKFVNVQIELFTKFFRNIVWDQTNLTLKSRRGKIDRLRAAGYEVVAVAFECPAEELKRRREERAAQTGKHIPPSTVEAMTAQYVRPTRVEGFDRVIIVTPTEEFEANE
jgi:predicted kinase